MDYAVNVEKSGTYTVSYEYVSRYAASLETQIDGVKAAESALDASTASGNWYDADYADSDTTGISFRLEKGMHTLSTLWSSADINVKSINLICKTPDPDPITLEVEAEKLSGGSYAVSEVAAAGDEPAHLQISTTQYANGRWIQNFPYAGQYKVQFVVKTPTDFNKINFYMGATSGEDSSLADNDGAWVQYGGNIALSSTNGEWATVDGPVVEISEPGYYDIKFGNWAAGPEAFLLL